MQTKHGRVHCVLKDEILDGKYVEPSAFPSEISLVRRFGVSRITVQRALRDLEREGLIRKMPRKGVCVVSEQERARVIKIAFPETIGEDDAMRIFRAAARSAAQCGFSVLRIKKWA